MIWNSKIPDEEVVLFSFSGATGVICKFGVFTSHVPLIQDSFFKTFCKTTPPEWQKPIQMSKDPILLYQ